MAVSVILSHLSTSCIRQDLALGGAQNTSCPNHELSINFYSCAHLPLETAQHHKLCLLHQLCATNP